VKTGEAKKGRPRKVETEVVDSQSDLTQKRMDGLEASQLQMAALLKSINEKLDAPQKMPETQKPEEVIKKFKAGGVDDLAVTVGSVDLRNPTDAKTGVFKEGSIVKLAEGSEKYAAYQFDEEGEPVKQKFQYECQACSHIQEYIKGPVKRICPECKATMLKIGLAEWEPGTPAYGIVQNYMYTDKKKRRKYKVWFEKFSANKRSEGLRENEMVLCQ